MTTSLLAYLAAPYEASGSIAGWHDQLAPACTCVDTWSQSPFIDLAPDPATPSATMQQLAAGAQSQVLGSHVFVLVNTGPSIDAYALSGFAYSCGVPIVWVGDATLAAHRPGVRVVADVAEATQWLQAAVTTVGGLLDSGNAYAVRQALRQRIDAGW